MTHPWYKLTDIGEYICVWGNVESHQYSLTFHDVFDTSGDAHSMQIDLTIREARQLASSLMGFNIKVEAICK